jgi:formate hydrogenlyase subunit 4
MKALLWFLKNHRAVLTLALWVIQFVLKSQFFKTWRTYRDAIRRAYYEWAWVALALMVTAFLAPSSQFRAMFAEKGDLALATFLTTIFLVFLFLATYRFYKDCGARYPDTTNWRDLVGASISTISLLVSFQAVETV